MVKKRLKIIWDIEAKKSLRNIYNYIKSRESVEVAKKVREAISSQARSLNDFPEKFERENHLEAESGNYRYKVIWSYKIIFEVNEESIFILDIFHTSRDPTSINKRK
ncbi:MAG: type II toxin-antitoxin system RelE/ParE family toxin [Cyclobacteriaceae bacterium]